MLRFALRAADDRRPRTWRLHQDRPSLERHRLCRQLRALFAAADVHPNGLVEAAFGHVPIIGRAPAALAVLAALAVASTTACSRHQDVASASSAAASQTSAAVVAGAAQTPAGQPTNTTFDVSWQPQTVQIDPATVSAAYRGVGDDGSLTFDAAAAPSVATLAPGAVVVFGGLMLGRVASVTNQGGLLHVNATPVALEDAVANGHIAWSLPIDFARVAFEPPPGLHRVDVADDPILDVERMFAEPARADGAAVNYKGTVKAWDVALALTPSAGNLLMDLDASKSIHGGTIDVHGVGELDNLTNSVDITLKNGTTTRIGFDAGNLKGKIDLKWSVAFDKEHGGDSLPELDESDVENLPFALTYPFLVGPIPFKIKLTSGFAFEPSFTSKATVAQGEIHQSFGGDVSLASDTSGGDPQTTSSVTGDGSIDSYGGTLSVAPLGLSSTLMLPSIALGLGGPPQFDKLLEGGPYALLLTQVNFIATGPLSIAACERRDLNFIVIAGYKTGLLGKLIKPARKELYRKNVELVEPPNITLCQPH